MEISQHSVLNNGELSKESAGDALSAYCYLIYSKQPTQKALSLTIEQRWSQLYPSVLRWTQKPKDQVFLATKACRFVWANIEETDVSWKYIAESGDFTGKDKDGINWQISLKKGNIRANNETIIDFPPEVLSSEVFNNLVGSGSYRLKAIDPNNYLLEYEGTEGTLLNAKICLQRPQESWLATTFYLEKTLEGRIVRSFDKTPFERQPQIPSLSDLKNYHYWLSLDGKMVLITDKNDRILTKMQLDLNNNKINKIIGANFCADLTDKGVLEKLPVVFDKEIWWQRDLIKFEKPEWIEVWRPKNVQTISNRLEQSILANDIVHLPRYALDFEVRTTTQGLQLFPLQNPGYFLVSSKVVGITEHSQPFLVLQKEDDPSTRKAILPFAQIPTPEKKATGSVKDEKPEFEKMSSLPSIEISIDRRGQLSPANAEQHLYLAYLALSQSKEANTAAEAERHLRLAWAVQSFTPRSLEMLTWIGPALAARRDASLAGLYLKLICQYEAQRHEDANRDLFPPFLGMQAKVVAELFSLYLKRHRTDPLTALTKEDQKMLVEWFKQERTWQTIQRQWNSLKPTIGSDFKPGKKNVAFRQLENNIHFARPQETDWIAERPCFPCTVTKDSLLLSLRPFLMIALGNDQHRKQLLKARLLVGRFANKDEYLCQLLLQAVENPENAAYHKLLEKLPLDISSLTYEKMWEIRALLEVCHKQKKLTAEDLDEKPIQDQNLTPKPRSASPTISAPAFELSWRDRHALSFSDQIRPSPEHAITSTGDSFSTIDPLLNEPEKLWLQDMVEDCQAYAAESRKPVFQVKEESLSSLKELFSKRKKEHQQELAKQLQAILQLANKPPHSLAERMKKAISRWTERSFEFTEPEQLIFSFLKGSKHEWQKQNSSLSEEECRSLDAAMGEYLFRATELQAIERQLSKIEALQQLLSQNNQEAAAIAEIQEAKEALAADLMADRAYSSSKQLTEPVRRTSLAFEYLSNLRLRQSQVDLIQNIVSGKLNNSEREFIAQLIMGSGKSKVILPLLAQLLADGKKMVILCVPKEQIGVQKEFLNRLAGKMFAKHAHTLHVERKKPIDDAFVKKTWRLFKQIQKNGEYLIVTPETLEALELQWHELREKDDLKAGKMRIQLAKLFDLLKKNGVIIIDEADKVLDIRSELNFSQGNPISIPRALASQWVEIYQLLSEYKDFGLVQNQQAVQLETAWPAIRQHLAETLAKRVTGRNGLADNGDLACYLQDPKLLPPLF